MRQQLPFLKHIAGSRYYGDITCLEATMRRERVRLFEPSIHQLRSFYYSATCGNFTRAAEALSTGQPSVTNHVKDLERGLGARLFERRPRGVRLTPEGDVLLEMLGDLVERVDRLKDEFDERCGRLAGNEVRLVASQQLLLNLLAPVLKRYQRDNPSVQVIVHNRTRPEVFAMVAAGEVDLGVAARAGLPPGLAFDEILVDELVLIAPPDHPLARRAEVSLEDIALHPLLVPDQRSSTRQTVREVFARRGLELRIGMELERWEVIKEFVTAGLGVALVPSFCVSAAETRLALKSVGEYFPRRSYGIVTRRGKHLASAARSLVAAIKDEVGRR
jgi:DNA-binding transcriptional LysR family regulator